MQLQILLITWIINSEFSDNQTKNKNKNHKQHQNRALTNRAVFLVSL
jgi:hypothetical protein